MPKNFICPRFGFWYFLIVECQLCIPGKEIRQRLKILHGFFNHTYFNNICFRDFSDHPNYQITKLSNYQNCPYH